MGLNNYFQKVFKGHLKTLFFKLILFYEKMLSYEKMYGKISIN